MQKAFNLFKKVSCLFIFVFSFFCSSCEISYAKSEKKLIVYIPPMLASTLINKETEEIAWLDLSSIPNSIKSIYNLLLNYKELAFDKNGAPVNSKIEVLQSSNTNNDYGIGQCDKKIMESLRHEFCQPGNDFDVIRCPYDFRDSCAKNNIFNFDLINNYDEIYFIGYSQGGLVLSSFLSKISPNIACKIKACIFLATPIGGTIEPLYVFNNGVRLGWDFAGILGKIFGVKNISKELTKNWPAMYELLPLTTLNKGNKLLQNKSEYAIEKAKAFQTSLYDKNGKHISEKYNSYYIAGAGTRTMEELSKNSNGTVSISKYDDGDGTVLFKNSHPINAKKEKIYKVNQQHTSILCDEVIKIIINIIKNN